MTLVSDLIVAQLHNQLNIGHTSKLLHDFRKIVIGNGIPLEQPEKIKMPEFRKKVFPIKLIIVQVVNKTAMRFGIGVNRKKILTPLSCQLYLNFIIDPEIKK